MRSRDHGQSTMESPPIPARPTRSELSPSKTGTAEATGADQRGDDTIDSESIMVWLKPAMMVGSARGN